MDAAAELGRNPVSKHQIQPEYGDEQADAGRLNPSRETKFSGTHRDRRNYFPCSADHEQDWQPYPVDPYSAICDDHTYIDTYVQHLVNDGLPSPLGSVSRLHVPRGMLLCSRSMRVALSSL